jgi:hypothetical protein
MARIFVKPSRAGLIVPLPDGAGQFAAEGQWTTDDTYVRRRMVAGELVEAVEKPVKPTKAEPNPAPATSAEDKTPPRKAKSET